MTNSTIYHNYNINFPNSITLLPDSLVDFLKSDLQGALSACLFILAILFAITSFDIFIQSSRSEEHGGYIDRDIATVTINKPDG